MDRPAGNLPPIRATPESGKNEKKNYRSRNLRWQPGFILLEHFLPFSREIDYEAA